MTAAATQESKPVGALRLTDGLWVVFAILLASAQLVIGTDSYYVALNGAFVLLWGASLKACGGVKTLTGAAVAYLGFQHVVCSQVAKVLLWQRPDTPLLQPILTMEVYVVGMAAALLACLIANLSCFTRVRPLLPTEIKVDRLRVFAYVTVGLMVLRYLGSPQIGGGGIRFLMNFDFLTSLAAASITAYQVLHTEGKKFLHPLSYVCIGLPFLVAMIGFQRKESVLALAIVVVVAVAYGFRFRAIHFMIAIALALFFHFIFFPFSLVFRGTKIRGADPATSFSNAWSGFTEVLANPLEYQEEEDVMPTGYDSQRLLYYDRKPIPTLDRMTTLIITDALVHSTVIRGTIGWKSIQDGFMMVVPSIFNKEKQILGTSNWLAHQAPGMVAPDDNGTQITMGFFAEAYMSLKMAGVFWVTFFLMLAAILIVRLSLGDRFQGNLWACSWIITVPWNISEGPVQINVITFLQTVPLFVAYGLMMLVIANSMSRTPDPDKDRLEEKPVFKDEGLRLAG